MDKHVDKNGLLLLLLAIKNKFAPVDKVTELEERVTTIEEDGVGSSGVEIVQTTGDSETAVMSQKAVTDKFQNDIGDMSNALDEIIKIQDALINDYEGGPSTEEDKKELNEQIVDIDYYAHWNVRVQQITADMPIIDRYMVEEEGAPSALLNKRGVAMLELNEEVSWTAWTSGKWAEYPVAIMHPKSAMTSLGDTNIDIGDAALKYLLLSKHIRYIGTLNFCYGILDLTLFTGDMPFPELGYCDGPPIAVYVQKGRKAELLALTNWSDLVIEELDTWSDMVMEEVPTW